MKKVIALGNEARLKLSKGACYLNDAVKSTLGPFGQNFLLEKGNKVTNDGVTVAREIECEDEIENRGVVAIREAAIKTNDNAGDGTTTATILAYSILKEAEKLLPREGVIAGKMTPASLIQKIEAERLEITEKLIAMSEKILTKDELIASAKVSVEDEDLSVLIGSAQWDIGPGGSLIAEETAEAKSSVEIVKGIRIDNGLGSSLVINNPEKQSLEVKDIKTILTNHVIHTIKPLIPVLDQLSKSGVTKVIIMGRGFSEQAIKECSQNTQGGFAIYPINAPYVNQNEVMKDLIAVLGGSYINTDTHNLDDIQLSDIGFASYIVSYRYTATFTGDNDDLTQKRIEKRVSDLQDSLKGEVSSFERNNIENRIAQLVSGFGIVKIGANSEKERGYKKDKADDAVNAVRAALQEGVVPGAGLAFKKIADELPDSYILKRALLAPYQQIRLF